MKILDPSAIPLSSIHSFSSENPNHLACNIIQTKTDQEYTNSWRCSKWSNYCWIVIDLNRPFLIDSIRLVNDGSAFVEIFASKSSNYSDFKVLVPVISLQSPSNCRKQTKNIKEFNINAEKFTSTKNIPCRLLKFVCSQPYNTDITYGLSSIKLFGIEYREEKVDRNEMSESLDKKFKLLQEGKCPINLMNPFDISSCDKRIKNDRIGLKKRARIIEKNETENVLRNSPNKKIEEIDLKDDKNLEPKLVKTSSSSKRKIMKIEEKIKNDAEDDGDVSRNKKKSSFKKLMSNVVFMTIGYDKSSQTDLIEKATLMGARHKSKWNPLECTHIICESIDSDKNKEINQSDCKIVTKNWIYDSYVQKKLLSWENYKSSIVESPKESTNDNKKNLKFSSKSDKRSNFSGYESDEIYDRETDNEDNYS